MDWNWLLPFPQVNQTLTLWQQVRLRVASFFLLRTGLVKNKSTLAYFKTVLFFSSPCQKQERISLWYLPWEPDEIPGDKSHNIVGPLYAQAPWNFKTLRIVHVEHPAFVNYHSGFPNSVLVPRAVFCLRVSVLISCDSIYSSLCPSSSGGSSLPWVFLLINPRRVVNFSVCSTFTC